MIEGKNDPYTLHLAMARALCTRATGPIGNITINNTFSALPDTACTAVIFTNTSGKTISVRRGSSGNVVTLKDGFGKKMDVVANANELQVANATDSTGVNLTYECAAAAF